MRRRLATLASFLVPGLGQALCGRVADALLFVWGALWLHAMTLGVLLSVFPELDGEAAAFAVGAFGVPRGFSVPEATVFTIVAAALHVFAAADIRRGCGPPARGAA